MFYIRFTSSDSRGWWHFPGQRIVDATRYEWVRSLAMRAGRHGYHRIAWSRDAGGRWLHRAMGCRGAMPCAQAEQSHVMAPKQQEYWARAREKIVCRGATLWARIMAESQEEMLKCNQEIKKKSKNPN